AITEQTPKARPQWAEPDGPTLRYFRSSGSQRPAVARVLRAAVEGDRGLRPFRVLRLSRGRAPFHAARHGAITERVPGRDRPAHRTVAFRHLRLCPSGASSASGAGRDLHARPHERWAAGDRLRPRLGAVRDFLLRAERGGAATDLRRAPGTDPEGLH